MKAIGAGGLMNPTLARMGFVSAAWMGLAACGGAPIEPAPTETAASFLKEDDFSDPSSGWPTRANSGWTQGYEDSVYRVTLDQAEWPYVLAAATAAVDVVDVVLEVDVRFVSNYAEAGAGVICRAIDADNYYLFQVEEATVSIVRILNDEAAFLVDRRPAGAVDPVHSRLRAECVGDRLTFIVNGQEAATAQDDSLLHGDVGMMAGGAGQGFTDVRFDNFSARSP